MTHRMAKLGDHVSAMPVSAAVSVPESTASSFVYVSAIRDSMVAPFGLDQETGVLTPVDTCQPLAGAWAIAASPNHKFLYAVGHDRHEIASYAINRSSGGLRMLGAMPIDTELGLHSPTYLHVDPSSQYLFTVDYFQDKVGVYAIGLDGVLKPDSQTVFAVGGGNTGPRENRNHPHSCYIDPTGKYLVVPFVGYTQTLGPKADNATAKFSTIRFYPWDSTRGKLGEADVARIEPHAGTGPRHLAFHPKGPWMYAINERGPRSNSVTLFEMHPGEAKLSEKGTWPTLPADLKPKFRNAIADVHITPDARFIYVSNRGHNSLAGFEISEVDGSLTPLGQFKTTKMPTTFTIDPSGRFVLSASVAEEVVAIHRIDADTGHLSAPTMVPIKWHGDSAGQLPPSKMGAEEGGTGTAWIVTVPKAAPVASKDIHRPGRFTAAKDTIAQGGRGGVGGPFEVFANSPGLNRAFGYSGPGGLGNWIFSKHNALDRRLTELAILVTARAWTAQVEWFGHVPMARKCGISKEAIGAIAERRTPHFDRADEQAVYDFASELHATQEVSTATFNKATALLGVDATVALTGVIGKYTMLAMTMRAYQMTPSLETDTTRMLPQ